MWATRSRSLSPTIAILPKTPLRASQSSIASCRQFPTAGTRPSPARALAHRRAAEQYSGQICGRLRRLRAGICPGGPRLRTLAHSASRLRAPALRVAACSPVTMRSKIARRSGRQRKARTRYACLSSSFSTSTTISCASITPDVGGGFGAKYLIYPEEVVVPLAARLLRRPVRWIEDRREHFLTSIQERDQYWDLQVALDDRAAICSLCAAR